MKKLIYSLLFAVLILQCKAQTAVNPGDTIGFWETINFDTTYQYIQISPSLQNLWQVGAPQKPIFNSSYSPMRAMVTDTLSMYPPSNHSWFDLYIGNFNYDWYYMYDIFIDFRHKFNTDTLHDGGYITVSWDKGQTWSNVIEDNVYWGSHPGANWVFPDMNLYTTQDTLFNGEYGFSGNSDGWMHTSLSWYMLPVKFDFPPDTMIVRFNFISDNIDNPKEGWMIDDIRLFSIDLGSGINEMQENENIFTLSPNPFSDNTEIIFNKQCKSIQIELFDLQGKLVFAGDYSNCDNVKLNRGKLPEGLFLLKATVDNALVGTRRIVVKN